MLEHLWAEFFRGVRRALGRVMRAWLLGLLLGGVVLEITAYAVTREWPPHVFTHVATVAFAIVLSYAFAITVALVQGVRGMVAVTGQLDDVAKEAVNAGINVLDTVVDAVDGPNRHGIR